MEEDTYTVREAARILRTTERTVRRRLERGGLEGTREPTTGRWTVAAHSVTAAMPDRPPKPSREPPEASQEAAELRLRVDTYQQKKRACAREREWCKGLTGAGHRIEAQPNFSQTAFSEVQSILG